MKTLGLVLLVMIAMAMVLSKKPVKSHIKRIEWGLGSLFLFCALLFACLIPVLAPSLADMEPLSQDNVLSKGGVFDTSALLRFALASIALFFGSLAWLVPFLMRRAVAAPLERLQVSLLQAAAQEGEGEIACLHRKDAIGDAARAMALLRKNVTLSVAHRLTARSSQEAIEAVWRAVSQAEEAQLAATQGFAEVKGDILSLKTAIHENRQALKDHRAVSETLREGGLAAFHRIETATGFAIERMGEAAAGIERHAGTFTRHGEAVNARFQHLFLNAAAGVAALETEMAAVIGATGRSRSALDDWRNDLNRSRDDFGTAIEESKGKLDRLANSFSVAIKEDSGAQALEALEPMILSLGSEVTALPDRIVGLLRQEEPASGLAMALAAIEDFKTHIAGALNGVDGQVSALRGTLREMKEPEALLRDDALDKTG